MKSLTIILSIVIISLICTIYAKFCDPEITPFNELIAKFNPQLNSAVEGYFISENTFKVTYSLDPKIEIGSENKVFEYGPFGSRCESYELGSNVDKSFFGAKNIRLLYLYKDRSKNGKLVTPIFYGEGVPIVKNKTVEYYYKKVSINKAPYVAERRFYTPLDAIRKWLKQPDNTKPLIWKSKIVEYK
ncbi:hypothetical protein GCM10023210_27540 [Chryseobacterium ginsengisoli]|uniref:Uncharacterized protein n=1 Tax=Chryseobacterium ginsengisoli TaxID=363853 RepID=A0ABP9MIT1_9FLAO